ncbi:carbonic anhydrase [Bifidobacterium gallicum]|uniref:carbonic anhydrase n=1 Tax=Bifidobacterium gallicum DSM 20093 = LMG 11596 TaxID=561180 RepID=D1NWA8_9BIFI|nr:carbonic anhydrase [Bifidobacterium gallicum]EFA22394.1 carbonate dehydratase [Bifidobacterium gallicum DSM 20093 = LMG 11596]KFI60095.1 carbonate dehydratase [Bifidobacterium gallicum DSM 20093 = LMG 11596]
MVDQKSENNPNDELNLDDVPMDAAQARDATEALAAEQEAGEIEQIAADDSTASGVWNRLLAGNRRFAEGKAEHPRQDPVSREALVDEQHPSTAVLSCADSRVAPEIVFDAGLGEMFVTRTAGPMIDDAVLATLELAITQLGVKLLVVMGHENCAAIAEACEELDALVESTESESGQHADAFMDDLDGIIAASKSTILREVGMSIWQARMAELTTNEEYEQVHIARLIEELVTRSEVIRKALADERLMIVGARYRVSSGLVEVLSF